MKVLTIIGTRPEAIKMAMVIKKLNQEKSIEHTLCVTGQHKELLYQALDIFDLVPDIDLKVMKPNQTLDSLTSSILEKVSIVIDNEQPDLVLVHGDTTTAFVSALAASYKKIKVGHVEAGLRTFNYENPFPEEMNRTLIGKLASIHFCPTDINKTNLNNEGIKSEIYVTGNTVIDSLLNVSAKVTNCPDKLKSLEKIINSNFILVTGHRRENFGNGFINICEALLEIAKKYNNYNIIYPVHLNPNVKNVVNNLLGNQSNIHLIDPQGYIEFIYLMKKCKLILTDSGGVQEEAPSLNKPVLVMRDFTERTEGLINKSLKLVGTDINKITQSVSEIIESSDEYKIQNPYGDGFASDRIIDIIKGIK